MQSILRLAAGWISACRESHHCGDWGRGSEADSSGLPTRVVDLGRSEGPCLLITKEALFDVRSQPYTALSHCWGAAAGHLVTTTANSKQMFSGIPIDEIPQTYIDAFEITKSLGIMYIWIDALCIYSHRTAMKDLGILKFAPRFFEGFNFTHLASQIWQYICPRFQLTVSPTLTSLFALPVRDMSMLLCGHAELTDRPNTGQTLRSVEKKKREKKR
jgi:hypothetical protein